MDHQRPAFAGPHAVEKLVQGVALRPPTNQAGAVLRQRRWLHRTETRRGANHILSNDDRVLSRTSQGGIVRTRLGSVWHTAADAPCSHKCDTRAEDAEQRQRVSSAEGHPASVSEPSASAGARSRPLFSLAPCTTRIVACALKASATF